MLNVETYPPESKLLARERGFRGGVRDPHVLAIHFRSGLTTLYLFGDKMRPVYRLYTSTPQKNPPEIEHFQRLYGRTVKTITSQLPIQDSGFMTYLWKKPESYSVVMEYAQDTHTTQSRTTPFKNARIPPRIRNTPLDTIKRSKRVSSHRHRHRRRSTTKRRNNPPETSLALTRKFALFV